MSRLIHAAIAAALLATGAPAFAESSSERAISELAAATADSPAAHEALARFYDQQASIERNRAERMRAAARHRVGKIGASAWNAAHADPGKDNEAAAAQYEQLAAMHRDQSAMLEKVGG